MCHIGILVQRRRCLLLRPNSGGLKRYGLDTSTLFLPNFLAVAQHQCSRPRPMALSALVR